ncbi:pentatricopeptide repeat-containing protein At1g09220, mitochondrial-like [Raphanus sativus]|uniref:Pentatricopeptide repeat-containing protein At1g09220, mitochondrial-like n=1 Tax=Raphanus sativus TaxID=3726 RepID=A0A6J0KLZ6_RAPSA|nr:pentatricopeptide repeat-containing protein At1g09220, mitochondrial-like [Raphanus sativus]
MSNKIQMLLSKTKKNRISTVMFLYASCRSIACRSYTIIKRSYTNLSIQHLSSLLRKNESNPRIIHQLHSHFTTAGLLLLPQEQDSKKLLLFNPLLRCYSLGETPLRAYFLYVQLQQLHFLSDHNNRLPPFDSFTYVFLLKATSNPQLGIGLHGLTLKLGFEVHVYVQTALVGMYLVAGNRVDAYKVFDEMPERSSVTWNVMITGLTNLGEFEKALGLLEKMHNRTVVSWTTLIDGYARVNKPKEAILLFWRMVACDAIKPNEITVLAILPAVWSFGDLRMLGSVHGYVVKTGFVPCDIRVTNSLIYAYAKCGCIQSSLKFFTEVPKDRKNLVSWTTMISAFSMHGMGKEAVSMFKDMERLGLKPNRVTMISVLNACSHGGLAEEEFLAFFNKMVSKYKITPDVKHYGCLVDMLRRKGRLEEAERIALEIPSDQKAVVWRMLLGACSVYDDPEIAERVTKKLMELERSHGGDYVLMSNIFCGTGRFADAQRFRKLMDVRGVAKLPGHSQLT